MSAVSSLVSHHPLLYHQSIIVRCTSRHGPESLITLIHQFSYRFPLPLPALLKQFNILRVDRQRLAKRDNNTRPESIRMEVVQSYWKTKSSNQLIFTTPIPHSFFHACVTYRQVQF